MRSSSRRMLACLLVLVTGLVPSVPALGTPGTFSPKSSFAPGEGPLLDRGPEIFDFGRVFAGDPLQHTFELRSAGDEDLIIHKIKPSCGCTVAEVWLLGEEGERTPYKVGTPLPPGSLIALDAEFKPQDRRGKQAKSVSIYSNDPKGVDSVTLKADIQTFLIFTEPNINLGRLSVTEARTHQIKLRAFDYTRFALRVDPDSVPEGCVLSVAPEEADASGKSINWILTLTVEEGQEPGEFLRQFRVVTDVVNPRQEPGEDGAPVHFDGKVAVSAKVLGLVTATPNFVSFGVLRGEPSDFKWVRINGTSPDLELPTPTCRLLDASTDEPFDLAAFFEIEIRPVADVPNAWDLGLRANSLPPEKKGVFRGRAVLEFDHPRIHGVPVSFTGFHRPKAGGGSPDGSGD